MSFVGAGPRTARLQSRAAPTLFLSAILFPIKSLHSVLYAPSAPLLWIESSEHSSLKVICPDHTDINIGQFGAVPEEYKTKVYNSFSLIFLA